eukprot:1782997-Pyramimonas_sp.AAC.1
MAVRERQRSEAARLWPGACVSGCNRGEAAGCGRLGTHPRGGPAQPEVLSDRFRSVTRNFQPGCARANWRAADGPTANYPGGGGVPPRLWPGAGGSASPM